MDEKKFYHCVVSIGSLMGVYHIVASSEDEAKSLAINQFDRDKDVAYYHEDSITEDQVIASEVSRLGTPKAA